jgi:hypothetical protein
MTLLARTGIVNTYTQPFSATGGTTTDSGGYRYHTFNSSGSFVVAGLSKSMDVLVVGGGQSGGHSGGAAGMFSTSTQTFATGTYTVTVGGGGSPSSIRTNGSGETIYNIGDTGPAGGIIFITPSTVGNATGKYFEVAPIAYRVIRPWCNSAYTSHAATSTDDRTLHTSALGIGSGERNTNSGYFQKYYGLGTANVDATGVNNALAYCYNFSYGGFSDWFMPSKDEGAFLPAAYDGVISSNEINNNSVYYAKPIVSGFTSKSSSSYVIPVRSFTVSSVIPVFAMIPSNFGNSTYITAWWEGSSPSFGPAGGGGATGMGQYFSYPGGGATGGAGGSGAIWNSFKSYGGGGGGGAESYSGAVFFGGAGGSNGGGAGGVASGSSLTNGVSGTVNTGGGGGGYSTFYLDKNTYESTAGQGGSGVVVVRYLL